MAIATAVIVIIIIIFALAAALMENGLQIMLIINRQIHFDWCATIGENSSHLEASFARPRQSKLQKVCFRFRFALSVFGYLCLRPVVEQTPDLMK